MARLEISIDARVVWQIQQVMEIYELDSVEEAIDMATMELYSDYVGDEAVKQKFDKLAERHKRRV